MLRFIGLLLFVTFHITAYAQRVLTSEDAVNLALNNQRNLKAASLSVQQQQELLRGAAEIQSPQVFGELTPYEPLIVGVQQTLSLPGVYRNRKALQNERIRLAQLQLQGSQYELKREVRLSFLQLQYLTERERLLRYQDSIFQSIKISSKRFFDAGQINKLEELQATSQADQVRNDLTRIQADLAAEKQIFRFYTNLSDSFVVESIQTNVFIPVADTVASNIQQQILRQQIAVSERQLRAERSELLPQFQAGVSFPTTGDYERPVGYQLGITIPIWRKQNRSRIAAAQTGIEITRATQELEQQRLNAQYRQALASYQRELQSLNYFNTTALPQARAIVETSQRLFQGGELNYIESLRNLQMAFDIFFNHADTHRAYNEAVIQLNYLNGTL
jgi:outer membrane protein TolC